jgi:inorganic pyrophosphatase
MENSDFWALLDTLVRESKIIIDRPKGSRHPRYSYIYAADYGYIENSSSMDGGGIDVWRGTREPQDADAVICTVDLIKRDSEIKILVGCTEEEKAEIMRFHNETASMKGLMFRR